MKIEQQTNNNFLPDIKFDSFGIGEISDGCLLYDQLKFQCILRNHKHLSRFHTRTTVNIKRSIVSLRCRKPVRSTSIQALTQCTLPREDCESKS